MLLALVAILVCVGVAAGVFVFLDRRDQGSKAADTFSSAAGSGTEATVRGYCADPRVLPSSAGVVAFTPGNPAVAFTRIPRPASSTDLPPERVIKVSPPPSARIELGLAKSLPLVSLAMCFDQTSSKPTGGTCDYELTNPDQVGERVTAKLLQTTYDVQIIELQTGKTVTSGTIATKTDACPQLAYTGGDGVSNALTDQEVLAWADQHDVATPGN